MFQLLLVIIYLAFISLGRPGSLLGSACRSGLCANLSVRDPFHAGAFWGG